MTDANARVNIEATGGPEAEKALRDVDKAQKGLAETNAEATVKSKDHTRATEAGAAALDDYAEALDRIVPGSGEWLRSLDSGVRVLGDLSEKQIDLTSLTNKGGEALTRYAGAIKLPARRASRWRASRRWLARWNRSRKPPSRPSVRFAV